MTDVTLVIYMAKNNYLQLIKYLELMFQLVFYQPIVKKIIVELPKQKNSEYKIRVKVHIIIKKKNLLLVIPYEGTVNEVIIYQILSVDLDTVYDNTLPMHIEIFLEAIQYVPHLINHMHLEIKKRRRKC